MELRDLVVTPIVFVLVLLAGFIVRPLVTDQHNRVYFLPALAIKALGAVLLGVIYQYYYSGGDTFNYHTYGSRQVWRALVESPAAGFQLLFSEKPITASTYPYVGKILFLYDPSSFFVVKVAAVFDLLTYSSYTATAILFSLFSFVGAWMLFLTFYNKRPDLHRELALCCLFIPSVILWGSGILKDTIVVACLGILTFELDLLLNRHKISILHLSLLILSLYFIFSVKKFVLQAFLPAALLWVYLGNLRKVSSSVLRLLLFPIVFGSLILGAYYAAAKIGEGDSKYSLEKIAETAMITAYDIRYYTGKDAGSGYALGELDGSFYSMLKLAPASINVSLFRPYPWEVKNPLMALSAIESIIFLILTAVALFARRATFFSSMLHPDVAFCFSFAIIFAFAVGISTYNFGTLARYKIPLLPYFSIGLAMLYYPLKRDKKFSSLDVTE